MKAVRRSAAGGFAVLALVGTLGLTACGDDGKDAAPKAPCGLKDTRTGHLTMKNVEQALSKAADRRMTQRFRQELTVDGKTAAIEGSVDASPTELVALEQTMPGDDGTVKLIVVDRKIYVSAEGEEDGRFYVVDPDDAADPLAAPMKAWFDSAGASNEAASWTIGLVDVRYVGTETLDDGSETELYEFDTNPRLVARATGQTPPAEMPQRATSYVWIDGYDLIRKVSTDSGTEKTVETFTDFCEPVDIEAPDAEDILER